MSCYYNLGIRERSLGLKHRDSMFHKCASIRLIVTEFCQEANFSLDEISYQPRSAETKCEIVNKKISIMPRTATINRRELSRMPPSHRSRATKRGATCLAIHTFMKSDKCVCNVATGRQSTHASISDMHRIPTRYSSSP